MDENSPDDFMTITFAVGFNAKQNPTMDDPYPIDGVAELVEYEYCLPLDDAADEMKEMVAAIEEGRFFGWAAQRNAELHTSTREWVEKTIEDQFPEAAKVAAANIVDLKRNAT